ncbi:MAG: hypothetical protein ACRDNP_11120 [Gaiellaceae bacterium]
MAEDFTELGAGLTVLEALDPNEGLTQEDLDIRAWRFSQLVEHGYELEDAMEIARAVHVDLEMARSLVAVHGCSSRLAVRILL